jgi:SNF2 family DNA or RNA helicase
MTDLTYHLSGGNPLVLKPVCPSKKNLLSLTTTSSEKAALELLLKGCATADVLPIPLERSFEILKGLGTSGRIFYEGKKVIVDPFSYVDLYIQAEEGEQSRVQGCWKLGAVKGVLHNCALIVPANPSWILKDGFIRPIKEGISSRWVKWAASGPKLLTAPELAELVEDAEEEIEIHWVSGKGPQPVEPLPFLSLACRHGGFADLWFDYGPYGKIAAHDPQESSWRNRRAEKSWEKDLLETGFEKKRVDRSHYYCPMDRVAKSLTFLLEIGWSVIDAQGRKVVRQKSAEFDAEFSKDQIVVRVKMKYGDHQADLKDLVGAFNRQEHFVSLSPHAVALLDRDAFIQEWGDFTSQEVTSEGIVLRKNQMGVLQPLLEKQHLAVREDLREKIAKLAEPTPITAPGLCFRGTLFSYQNEGLQWLKFLEEGNFGGLLADEMGLGKTVQVLAFFSLLTIERPSLIVVPTSLLFNWAREFEKFLPNIAIYSHHGKDRLRNKEELEQKQIIVTSYALLRIDADLLQALDYQVVVLDEAQTIKNPDSQIAGCCFKLNSRMRLSVTGTPIENRWEDLWSIFHFLEPDLLGEKATFLAEAARFQMGAPYLARIKRKLRPFILRRKKEQVALQLPPKLEQTVFVDMNEGERAIYERWLRNTKQGLLKKVTLDGASAHRMEILEAILRLRQLCDHPFLVEQQEEGSELSSAKFERVMADLQEVVEEKHKVLIYSQFTKMLRLLESAVKEKGWKYVYLDGSTQNREQVVGQFQEDGETSIFLISLKAGGVGLNLTAADYVFLYDPWWNEAVERQAIDRAHRLGKIGTVIARRYITALSIEEKILKLKAHKSSLSQQLLDSENGMGEFSLDDLLALLD